MNLLLARGDKNQWNNNFTVNATTIKDNLIFAKQALKTGIYAPDMQQSGMKGIALSEYKSIYYRILDDIAEITQRAYQ